MAFFRIKVYLLLFCSLVAQAASLHYMESLTLQENTRTKLIAVEPQGRYLYAVDDTAGRVEVYGIDANTGALTPAGETSGENIFTLPGFVQATDIAFSPDGRFVFVTNVNPAANGGSPFYIYDRGSENAAGSLGFEFAVELAALPGLTAAHAAGAVAIDTSASNLYVAASDSSGNGEVHAFGLQLSESPIVVTALSGSPYINGVDGVNGLGTPSDMVLGGTSTLLETGLYIASGLPDNSLVHFTRASNGELQFSGVNFDGQNGVSGLYNISSLFFNRRRNVLYTLSPGDGTPSSGKLGVFRLTQGTPQVSFAYTQGSNGGFDALDGAVKLFMPPSETSLYSISVTGHAVSTYVQSEEDESVFFIDTSSEGQTVSDGQTLSGILGANAIASTPDARFIYIGGVGEAGSSGNQLALFSRISDLQMSLHPPNYRLEPGRVLPFTATVTNNGPADAPNAVLTVRFPSSFAIVGVPTVTDGNVAICESSIGEIECTLGTVPVSGQRSIHFDLSQRRTGEYDISAMVRSDNNVSATSLQASDTELIKVGGFNNGALSMSIWMWCLLVPWLYRRFTQSDIS